MAPLPSPGSFSAVAPDQWQSGASLELSSALGGRQRILNGTNNGELSLRNELENNYSTNLKSKIDLGMLVDQGWREHEDEILEMYSFYEMLPQRSFLLNEIGIPNAAEGLFRRRWLARESDCSDWFLQPCLMVIGVLENVPSPIPLKIDGESVDSDGTVVLRWIHPLPIDGELIRPSPRTLQPFQYPKPEVDES